MTADKRLDTMSDNQDLCPFLLLRCPQAAELGGDLAQEQAFYAAYRPMVEAPFKALFGEGWAPYLFYQHGLTYRLPAAAAIAPALAALAQSHAALLAEQDALLARFGVKPSLQAALDAGPALPMAKHWHHSVVPQRLPLLLQVAEHYGCWLVVGESAKPHVGDTALTYLTRSYLDGQRSALEIWGNPTKPN